MPTLPTTVNPGDAGHLGHHDALHAMFDQADGKGDLLVATAADAWDNLAVGADGRFLIADSTTATGLRWSDEPIVRTLLDAKGDIIAATAADTAARLAVGTNGQALIAASGQATGLQWGNHNDLAGLTTGDPHTQYPLKSLLSAKGALIGASAASTPVVVAVGSNGALLLADSGQTSGLRYSLMQEAYVATLESTTIATYTDLTTVGPAITLTVGASGLALIGIAATCSNGAANSGAPAASFQVGGATGISAEATLDSWNVFNQRTSNQGGGHGGTVTLVSGLTPGVNTFQMRYKDKSGTSTTVFFQDRRIWGLAL